MSNDPRSFELAYGMRVAKDPLDMSNQELIDSLYDIASFGSSKLIEARALSNILQRRLEGK